jgi:hypothetical protein
MTNRMPNNYTYGNFDSLLNGFNNIRITPDPVNMKNQLDALKNDISTNLNNFLNNVYVTQQTDTKIIYDKFSALKDDFIKDQAEGDNKIIKTNIKTAKINKAFEDINKILSDQIATLQNIQTKDGIKNYQLTNNINQRLQNNDYDDAIYKNVLDKTDKTNIGYLSTLDSPNVINLGNDKMVNETDITSEKINTRLNNCYVLEHLYLKKHDELYTVFSFTVNLFDKYKHAIDILLFMIKYLVKYNNTVSGSAGIPLSPETTNGNNIPKLSVKLPKTIIKDIHALVKDQDTVQKIISSMKNGINNNPVVTENVRIEPNLLNLAP